ncbi:hypothetical protein TKK_0013399 [Trichogramma kaykai]
MKGIKRVAIFCTLMTVLPAFLVILPIYLRKHVFKDREFTVIESDILDITSGISPIFCSEHSLKMNGTFDAFQISERPEKPSFRKHIRLKKSMTLPDDTFEYWGFYLKKEATVILSFCSRFKGATILFVKGEKNLSTCGMLDHNRKKAGTVGILSPQVKITFQESVVVSSGEKFNNAMQLNNESHVLNPGNILSQNTSKAAVKELLHNDNATKVLVNTFSEYLNKTHNEISLKQRHLKKRMLRLEMLDEENEKLKESNDEGNLMNQTDDDSSLKYKIRLNMLKKQLMLDSEAGEKEENNHAMEESDNVNNRFKRQGIVHGGNVPKHDTSDESYSSFENGLDECFEGRTLSKYKFDDVDQCLDVNHLLSKGKKRAQLSYDIPEDGYYYFIFYNNNDIVSNDIHAIFEIYKPSLLHENVTRSCINQTECTFQLTMTSSDMVVVEVPIKDGIEQELDDVSKLVSTCVPRMAVYAIFPIAILFLILGCAFM